MRRPVTARHSTRPRRATAQELQQRWELYRSTGDRAHRDELVFLLTPLVRHIVGRKARQLPSYCEIDDLAGAGFEALVASIERFDPEKGASLDQFAWTRIHGAVLDELRRRDWAPRSLRRWEREAEQARCTLRDELDREPEDAEVALRMDMTTDELRSRRDQLHLAEIESLSVAAANADGATIERTDTIASSDPDTDPERAVMASEARGRLVAALTELPERERRVAMLLYVEGRRLREIGDMLGVSESRVCQINSALRRRLRDSLGDHADLLATAVA
ncbi:MAG: FliA/WhiG family RNA polymerase sigma factor [Solirubrobacteraceae bacterium]|nr:FliA/WhiG family RNA polymerase sigma factor [Solirubrobacteraceae bacterium]